MQARVCSTRTAPTRQCKAVLQVVCQAGSLVPLQRAVLVDTAQGARQNGSCLQCRRDVLLRRCLRAAGLTQESTWACSKHRQCSAGAWASTEPPATHPSSSDLPGCLHQLGPACCRPPMRASVEVRLAIAPPVDAAASPSHALPSYASLPAVSGGERASVPHPVAAQTRQGGSPEWAVTVAGVGSTLAVTAGGGTEYLQTHTGHTAGQSRVGIAACRLAVAAGCMPSTRKPAPAPSLPADRQLGARSPGEMRGARSTPKAVHKSRLCPAPRRAGRMVCALPATNLCGDEGLCWQRHITERQAEHAAGGVRGEGPGLLMLGVMTEQGPEGGSKQLV